MVLAADGRRICGTPGCNLPDFHKGPCAGWAPKKRVSQPVMQLNVRPEPVRSRAPAKIHAWSASRAAPRSVSHGALLAGSDASPLSTNLRA